MNKKIRLVFLALLLVLLFPISIESVNADESAVQQAGEVYGCGGAEWCWPESKFGGLVNGLRVSFYHKDGYKVGKSLDFVNSYTALNAIKNTSMYTANTGYTKLDYLANGSSISNPYWWWNNFGNVSNIYYLEFSKFLSGSGGTSIDVFTDYLRINNLDDVKYKFENFETNFQFPYGINLDKIISNPADYYLIVEPITVLINQRNGNYYYGTYVELQMLRSSYPISKTREDRLVGVDILFRKNTTKSSGYSLAKSIYLGKAISASDSKFKSTLTQLHNKTDERDIANSSTKYNTYVDTLDNGYGIGALWLNTPRKSECSKDDPNWNPKTNSCVPSTTTFDKCEVLEPKTDSCVTGNGNAIEYQYTNCTLDDDNSNFIQHSYKSGSNTVTVDIARIQCSEKYYIATFHVANDFHTIVGTNPSDPLGILAGSYYSISGPVVYHKKTCNYVDDISSWDNFVEGMIYDATKSEGGCQRKITDYCPTYDEEGNRTGRYKCGYHYETDTNCANEWNAIKKDKIDLAKKLKQKFNGLNNNLGEKVNSNVSPDTLPDIKLDTIISNETKTVSYELTPTFNKLEDLRQDYGYGYKTTYIYGLKQVNNIDINRYISLDTISDAKSNSNKSRVLDLGHASITTPINIKDGVYNYSINYKDIFNNKFKSIIKKYSNNKYDIDNTEDISTKQCPYSIFSRNIEKFCTTNCGDPNERFTVPKIKMIYRPINLNYPFPGKDGNGRTPGLNWNIEAINQYITYNRNTGNIEENKPNPDAVYAKKTLYTIKLDSSKIKAIREYNKTHAYDDFELDCTEGTGTECISKFLRDYDLITSGTCKDVTKDNFYSCADK